MLPEMLGRTQEPFDLQFTDPSGAEVDGAFLIQVSNNPYVLGATLDASQRRRMDTGRLGIVAISARTGSEAAEVVRPLGPGPTPSEPALARVHGHPLRSPVSVRSRLRRHRRRSPRLSTPLEFQIHPRGLRLLVPRGESHCCRETTGQGCLRSPTCSPSPGARTRLASVET